MKAYSLHNPVLTSSDKKYLNEACKSTWISANGKYINLLEKNKSYNICKIFGSL